LVDRDPRKKDDDQGSHGKKRGADSLIVISLFAAAILFLIALLYFAY